MQVRIKNLSTNRYLPTVTHEDRTHAIAPSSGVYHIALTNTSTVRQLAVPAVDGLSAMDGTLAKRGDKKGYVVEPGQTIFIKGRRLDSQDVSEFVFTPQEGSYSNQMGHGTQNTGVISVAVFNEKPKPKPKPVVFEQHHHHHHHHHNDWWGTRPYRLGDGPSPYLFGDSPSFDDIITCGGMVPISQTDGLLGGARASTSSTSSSGATRKSRSHAGFASLRHVAEPTTAESLTDLGTGFGSRASMQVETVEFECATDNPSEVIVLYYNTRERLKARGIPVDTRAAFPNPFPGSGCPTPPGWEG